MEVTQEIMDVIESMKVSEDERQDFYVHVLEMDEPDGIKDMGQFLRKRMYNLSNNARWVESNRKRILEEHADDIRDLYGKGDDDYDPGPEEQYIREEIIEERLKLLSPLLEATARMLLTGSTIEEIAKAEGMDTNAVYQRLHQIRKILEENKNG
jgi:DNA-directed RNA polymerase specialized sigma24 family protein